MEIVGLRALIAAASARDIGTNAHAHRIVQLAEATACKLQRPEDELHLIRLGALLHDIGKIGIPDAILHKRGPLTEEEWSIMRSHPVIGRLILQQVGGIFEYLAAIIVAHHERWDGKGYPFGLAGEDIPMNARILSVVDSYDAMTSVRPYRKPISASEARAELKRCAGSQFDPAVVEAFLGMLDDQDKADVEGQFMASPSVGP
jgi:HD-GYP domain-containing protein (c-di-GMP phosphodiesterase class II)